MQLTDLFDNSLKGRRDEIALECDSAAESREERGEESSPASGKVQRFTFGELDARANRLAHVLVARGLKAGDRLCLRLPNGVLFVDFILACARLGVVLVPVSTLYRQREISHILADSEPAAFVLNADDSEGQTSTVPTWSADVVAAEAAAASDAPVRQIIDGDAPALLIYTSGTTGRSKGAVLSHNNLMANATTISAAWQINTTDRFLCVLPLFHVHGLGNGVISWLVTGCRMRLASRFDLSLVPEWFAAFSPTLFFGVPTIYHRLVELPPGTARAIGAGMRLFVCGSAPLPAQLLDDFRQRFGHTILERYGMSETLMICSNPLNGERRPGTVGQPLPGVSLRIIGADGGDVEPGEVGEIWMRGPSVITRYWNQRDATAASFDHGWFKTGDLASRSDDGYVTLHGRRSDLIISGGYNIYPREIEEVLLEQPGVVEAAVVGVPDETFGERPIAYVVGNTPDFEALASACKRQLATFKVPRAFIRVDALPRNAMGKVQKHLLPQWQQ